MEIKEELLLLMTRSSGILALFAREETGGKKGTPFLSLVGAKPLLGKHSHIHVAVGWYLFHRLVVIKESLNEKIFWKLLLANFC